MTESKTEAAAIKAREASLALAALSESTRNAALIAMAKAVEEHRDEILRENQKDLDEAEKLLALGKISKSDAKRLDLRGAKFDGVIESLRSVEALLDPLGRTLLATELDEGLNLYRVSCPIGVIAIIFESRPDALPQIASLCFKSGNAVLLKGGSEAANSNRILAQVLYDASLTVPGVPEGWMTLLETRGEIAEILTMDKHIDLIIPRGGNALCRYIMDNTKIPVTGHRDGICHTYVHSAADPGKAVRIVVDGKCQYPSVCNATETLLIDKAAAEKQLLPIVRALREKGVELHVDQVAKEILLKQAHEASPEAHKPEKLEKGPQPGAPACIFAEGIVDATEEDWGKEYLDLKLAVRVVKDLDEAITHINRYGSHHTDSIVTENAAAADRFLREVDSASVMHNASTRFADGFRYGLGAEIGISTEKIHSRGPVGLEGLTIYKYILKGSGQIVADYSGSGARKFTHKALKA